MRISNRRARRERGVNWYADRLKYRSADFSVPLLIKHIETGVAGGLDALYLLHILRVKDAQIEELERRIEILCLHLF